ncbi:UNVERIFIED_CONTAM: hypothetical protein NCL1_44267 [Trichonephila clavipes]
MKNGTCGHTPMVRAVMIDGKNRIRVEDRPTGTQMAIGTIEVYKWLGLSQIRESVGQKVVMLIRDPRISWSEIIEELAEI